MATLTIRNLPDDVRDRLRVRAAQKRRSMEAEAREILTVAVSQGDRKDQSSPESRGSLRTLRAAAQPGEVTNSLTTDARLAAWTQFQGIVRAGLPRTAGAMSGVEELLRDRRRESIVEMIKDGDDPREQFGEHFSERIAQAGFSEADIESLRSRPEDVGK